MVDTFLRRDAQFIVTKALPASAGTNYTAGLDTGLRTSRGAELAEAELLLTAPALTTTHLPDTETAKYFIQCDADVNFGSPKTIAADVIVQTGAGGAGAAAATARLRLPTTVEQYVRMGVTTSSGAGDCSGKYATLELLF